MKTKLILTLLLTSAALAGETNWTYKTNNGLVELWHCGTNFWEQPSTNVLYLTSTNHRDPADIEVYLNNIVNQVRTNRTTYDYMDMRATNVEIAVTHKPYIATATNGMWIIRFKENKK